MNNFLKNRFFQTIQYGNSRCTSSLKLHYITVSENDIKKWERKNGEEESKKIRFGQEDEKNFEVQIIDGDNIITKKVKLTELESEEEFIYPLKNNITKFTIGEYEFSLGREFFDDYEDE